jgi:hypothetical protein
LVLVKKDLWQANEGLMFNISLMENFYKLDYEDDPQVRNAWYIYCYHFLRQVSSGWNTALSSRNIKNKTNMVNIITVSDEALIRWFLKIKISELTESVSPNSNTIKLSNRISRDTKSKLWMYKLEHQNIRIAKSDRNVVEKWNEIFWEECHLRNGNLFTSNKRVRKSNSRDIPYIDLPLPGLDDEVKLYDMKNGKEFVCI